MQGRKFGELPNLEDDVLLGRGRPWRRRSGLQGQTNVLDRIIGIMAAAASSPASAAEYLIELRSEVFQAAGAPREIVTRATTCISQHLSSGTTDSQLIISSDPDGGIIVARIALEYGSLPRWKIRSTFTFTARDGRFRIDQTNLERFNANPLTGVGAWGRIGKWTGSGWKKVELNFAASATAVAQCVIGGPKSDVW